jgi:TRAP-type transport system periplasmic protein
MAAAIKTETDGRFELQIFPSSQLGSDTDTLSQVRSGAVEFFTLSGLILSGARGLHQWRGVRVH